MASGTPLAATPSRVSTALLVHRIQPIRLMQHSLRRIARYVLRAILLALAVLYFLIDLLFLSLLRPLRRRLMALRLLQRLRESVATWNRYAALLLLLVPWAILEPVKPIALYLFAHHHHSTATLLVVGGEIVKLTLLDQVFDMTKPKLMTFAWFAWGYGRWQAALERLRALPAWRRVRAWYRTVRAWLTLRFRSARRAATDTVGTKEP